MTLCWIWVLRCVPNDLHPNKEMPTTRNLSCVTVKELASRCLCGFAILITAHPECTMTTGQAIIVFLRAAGKLVLPPAPGACVAQVLRRGVVTCFQCTTSGERFGSEPQQLRTNCYDSDTRYFCQRGQCVDGLFFFFFFVCGRCGKHLQSLGSSFVFTKEQSCIFSRRMPGGVLMPRVLPLGGAIAGAWVSRNAEATVHERLMRIPRAHILAHSFFATPCVYFFPQGSVFSMWVCGELLERCVGCVRDKTCCAFGLTAFDATRHSRNACR